jgi:hypothetical protein
MVAVDRTMCRLRDNLKCLILHLLMITMCAHLKVELIGTPPGLLRTEKPSSSFFFVKEVVLGKWNALVTEHMLEAPRVR